MAARGAVLASIFSAFLCCSAIRAVVEDAATAGAGGSEVSLRVECEVPYSLVQARVSTSMLPGSAKKQLRHLCYKILAYEDQDVSPESSRATDLHPIMQGSTEGRWAQQDPMDLEGPWRIKFEHLMAGEIEFDKFPETWEFTMYADVVDDGFVEGGECAVSGRSKDLVGVFAITGETIKDELRQKRLPKVAMKALDRSGVVAELRAAQVQVSDVQCILHFTSMGFEDFLTSPPFHAEFTVGMSIDFTGSNTWTGPGEFAGMSGMVNLKRSQPLHHLPASSTRKLLEDANDWSAAADDAYNQYIMPIKRVMKTLSEYLRDGGAEMSFFGGRLSGEAYLNTITQNSGHSANMPVEQSPGSVEQFLQGETFGERGVRLPSKSQAMPFFTLKHPIDGKGDALVQNVVHSYMEAAKTCTDNNCWAAPTEITPSIYWAVRGIVTEFATKLQKPSMTIDEAVESGPRQSTEQKRMLKREECKDHNYHVLTIFTDGDWSDAEQLRAQNFIGKFACKLPLSIVIIGVGEGDADDRCEKCTGDDIKGYYKIKASESDNCVCPSGDKTISVKMVQRSRSWDTAVTGTCSTSERAALQRVEAVGGVEAMAATKDAHVDCSKFPRLEELDGDEGTSWYFRNWQSEEKPVRDIIQSVIMQSDEISESVKAISANILEEIPDQFEDYFKNYCHLSPLGENTAELLKEIDAHYEEYMEAARKDWEKYDKATNGAVLAHVDDLLAHGTQPSSLEFQQYRQLQSAKGMTDQEIAQHMAEEKAKIHDPAAVKQADDDLDKWMNMVDLMGTKAEQEQAKGNTVDKPQEWRSDALTAPLLMPELDMAKDLCPPTWQLIVDADNGDWCQNPSGNNLVCMLKECVETTVAIEANNKAGVRAGVVAGSKLRISEVLEEEKLSEVVYRMDPQDLGSQAREVIARIKAEGLQIESSSLIGITRSVKCVMEGRSLKTDGSKALCHSIPVDNIPSSSGKEKSGTDGKPHALVAGGSPYSGSRAGKPASNFDPDLF